MSSVKLMSHFPNLKFAANISTMYNEFPFDERISAAKRSGFDYVEIQDPYVMPKLELKALLDKNEVKAVLINSRPGNSASEFGLTCIPGREYEFQMNLKEAIEYAYGIGCPRIHILAGLINEEFTPKDFRATYVNNLNCAADMLETYCITGLIEPISPVVKENYFLDSFERALEILREVESTQIKLLLDIYHFQMIRKTVDGLNTYLQHADHVQVSQAPNRNEPSADGEINYKEVFELLQQHYSGYIGLEYKPSGESTEESLQWPL